MRRHSILGSFGSSMHTCDHCSKTFGRKGDLTRHRYLHMGVRRFRCDKCDKSFNQLAGWRTHQNVHNGNKPYVCGYDGCRVTFGDPSSCARHRKETHRRIGAYCCPEAYCTSRIKRRSAFAAHLRKHGIDTTSVDLDSFAPPLLPAPKMKRPKHLTEKAESAMDFTSLAEEELIDQFGEESSAKSSTSSTPIEALPWSTDYIPTQNPLYPTPYMDLRGTKLCPMDSPLEAPISGEYIQYPFLIPIASSAGQSANEMKHDNNQTYLYPDMLYHLSARDVTSFHQNSPLSFELGKFYPDLPLFDWSVGAWSQA